LDRCIPLLSPKISVVMGFKVEEWDSLFDISARPTFILTRKLLPLQLLELIAVCYPLIEKRVSICVLDLTNGRNGIGSMITSSIAVSMQVTISRFQIGDQRMESIGKH